MNETEEILRRIVAWYEDARPYDERWQHFRGVMNDARAYLSRPKPVHVELDMVFTRYLDDDGADTCDGWMVNTVLTGDGRQPGQVKVRIPVPAHLLNPPVIEGEIVND